MKKVGLIIVLSMLSLVSCKKVKYGNAIFWQQTGSGYGITVVFIDGISSNVTSNFGSSPSCGQSGCATFNGLEVGVHDFTASDGTTNWSGSVSISKNNCTTTQLQ